MPSSFNSSDSTMTEQSNRKYSLRPQGKPVGDSTLEGGYRVFISPHDMQIERLVQGDYIEICSETDNSSGLAIVWRATDNIGAAGNKSIGNPIIRISEWLRGSYSFELKDKVTIKKWTGNLHHIDSVVVTHLSAENDVQRRLDYRIEDVEYWANIALGRVQC
jgi:hypothetical protein